MSTDSSGATSLARRWPMTNQESTPQILECLEGYLQAVVEKAVESAVRKIQEEQALTPEWVSVDKASEITCYSKNSIYQMHSRGQIPGAKKVGNRLLFKVTALYEWMENGGNKSRMAS